MPNLCTFSYSTKMKLDADSNDRILRVVTRESDKKEMKEGDYLRQGIVLDDISDDEDVKKSGCLPHRPRSASPCRRRHDSDQNHHSIAEKLLKFFRPHGSQTGSGRQSPTSRGGGQPPRRRLVRVVRDENAPPPECIGDNPNVICRYSQQYLAKHYAEVERHRDSSKPTLPYTTSGHTILKKSSTDPTSDRSAPSTSIKHTTFCDVVTVVDSDVGEVREERLRLAEDDIDAEENSPSQSGFFLSPAGSESGPADDVDGLVAESCSAVRNDDELVDEVLSEKVSSVGLMSVFSTAASPESDSSVRNPEEARKISATLSTTKHVKLIDLMAQMRADDDGERS